MDLNKLYEAVGNKTAQELLDIDINDLNRLPRKELVKALNKMTSTANRRIQGLHPTKSGANSPALNYLARQQGVNLDRAKGYQKTLEGVREMRHEQLKDLKREIRLAKRQGRGYKRLEKRLAKAEDYYKGVIKDLQKKIKKELPKFSTKGKSVNQLRALYSDIKSFMNARTSTQEGFEQYREEVAEELGDYITSDAELESNFWDAFHRFLDNESDFVYEKTETNKVLNWFTIAVEQTGAQTTDQMYQLLRDYNKEQNDLDNKWKTFKFEGKTFEARDVDFYKR